MLTKLINAITSPNDVVLKNYIIPGLESRMYAATLGGGKIRMFRMTRHQETEINIHDHRYAFEAFVLKGSVDNTTWHVRAFHKSPIAGVMDYSHVLVKYMPQANDIGESIYSYVRAVPEVRTYGKGDTYSMTADEFHSIRFSEGAEVLMIEKPPVEGKVFSNILLPYVDGEVCNTFFWRDWMMKNAKVQNVA